jgi:hypothetical protein
MNRERIIKLYKNWKVIIPDELKKQTSINVDIKLLKPEDQIVLKSTPLWDIRGIGPALAVKLTKMNITTNNIGKYVEQLP